MSANSPSSRLTSSRSSSMRPYGKKSKITCLGGYVRLAMYFRGGGGGGGGALNYYNYMPLDVTVRGGGGGLGKNAHSTHYLERTVTILIMYCTQ